MSTMYVTEPATSGKVCLQTTVGDIDIELWSRECPVACRNFVQLCMEGYYNGCLFHRLIRNFIVQTGDPSGTGNSGESIYGELFKSEFHSRLKFNRRGLVGTAGDKNQNDSQFFFTLDKATELDNKNTLFGKVVGNTVFNLLKLNECEVDKNERPLREHKILGAKILVNPFNDIEPRKKEGSSKRSATKSSKSARKRENEVVKKNTALLSFGDEMEEDEAQIAQISKSFKGKSAHDVLEDELLSRERAVKPEELSGRIDEEGDGREEEGDEEGREERLDRIKRKLKGGRDGGRAGKKVKFGDDDVHEADLDQLVDDQKGAEKREEMEKISSELKQLQKEYKKSMRPPKQAGHENAEANSSEGMKMYNKLKLKFKSGTKGIVKSIDPKREEQTIALLDRFQTKLQRTTVQDILFDKAKVDMSDQRTQEEIILATSEDQGQIDLDAEDIQGDEWMSHELVAPEDTSGVTKAKDANMKEYNDEWYPTNDPRNQLNVQRRTQGGKVPDLFKGAEPMALP